MITHEEATDKNIITKQVVINTPTSARLLPITADEKVIDEIQQALNELERLKKFEKLLKDYKDILETYEKGADNTTHGSTPYITYQVKFTHIVSNVNTYAERSVNVDEMFYVNEIWRMPNNINIVDFINEKYNVVGGISYVILNNKGML